MARPKTDKAPAPVAPVEDADWDAPEAEQALEQSVEEPAPAPEPPKHLTVRCISDLKPWTDTKALDNGEEVTLPVDIAELLLSKKLVERV